MQVYYKLDKEEFDDICNEAIRYFADEVEPNSAGYTISEPVYYDSSDCSYDWFAEYQVELTGAERKFEISFHYHSTGDIMTIKPKEVWRTREVTAPCTVFKDKNKA